MKLDNVQRWIILGGVIAFLLMGLVPPWTAYGRSAGYSPIVAPPEQGSARIDYSRLILQWILLAVGTACGAWARTAFNPKKSDQPTMRPIAPNAASKGGWDREPRRAADGSCAQAPVEPDADFYVRANGEATSAADETSVLERMLKRLETGRVTPKTAAEDAILAALVIEGLARRVGNAYERVI